MIPKGGFGRANSLGRDRGGTGIDEPTDLRPGPTGLAEECIGRHADAFQAESARALAEIHPGEDLGVDTFGGPLDHGEGEGFGIRARTKGHDEEIRQPSVGYDPLVPGQDDGLPVALPDETNSLRLQTVALFEQRERPDRRSIGQARQPVSALLVATNALDRLGGLHAGDQRRREERAARLLQQHHESDEVEPDSAVRFWDRETDPAQLGHARPQAAIQAFGRRHDLADFLQGRVLVEELAHFGAQQLLFFRKSEIHARQYI